MLKTVVHCLITLTITLWLNTAAQSRPVALAAAPDNAVQAPCWILLDPVSGRVLEEKNARQRMFPASTTKILTALLAIESGKLDDVFVIGPNPAKTGEQSLGLLPGERFALRDLVRGALIKSANDACVAIAEAVSGDLPSFVKKMNERAKELGANDSHFVNPHGLHAANHYTTAYDLALIARAAMQNPHFNAITATKEAKIHGNWKIGAQRELVNRNRLLFRWELCDGVKTGYTRQAGRCLVAAASRQDKATGRSWRLLCVVLHSPNSWRDARTLIEGHGFKEFSPFVAAHKGESFGEAPTENGGATAAILAGDALLTLRAGEEQTLTREVKLLPLAAPLVAGQRVGELRYFAGGRPVAALPLVAQGDVQVAALAGMLPSSRGRIWWVLAVGVLPLAALRLNHDKKQRAAKRRAQVAAFGAVRSDEPKWQRHENGCESNASEDYDHGFETPQPARAQRRWE